jgi:hypothetical protein
LAETNSPSLPYEVPMNQLFVRALPSVPKRGRRSVLCRPCRSAGVAACFPLARAET